MTRDARIPPRTVAWLLVAAVFLVFAVGALPKTLPDSHAMMGECAAAPCGTPELPLAFCVTHCLSAAQADHAVNAVVSGAVTAAAMLAALPLVLPRARPLAAALASALSASQRLRGVDTVVLRE